MLEDSDRVRTKSSSLTQIFLDYSSMSNLRSYNYSVTNKEWDFGISLVAQWLRLHAPNAGGLGSIPGQGTRSHMHDATKEPGELQLRSPQAATKTRRNQIN